MKGQEVASFLQKLYWHSPYFMKCAMASLNAVKLDRQRHNKSFYEHIRQMEQHNSWSSEQLAKFQSGLFKNLIKMAAFNIPYYRELFKKSGLTAEDFKDFKDLNKLPILEKSVVRKDPESLLDQRLDKNKLLHLSTSGTTGTPLRLYRTHSLNAFAFALNEARNHAAAGMRRRVNRSVSIGGHLVTAPNCKYPPFWVYNKRWNQLYMSSYHLSPENMRYYVDKLRTFKADYVEGYPSSIAAIAQYIIEKNVVPVEFKACFTTAEVLTEDQRKLIKQAFLCRTYDQYGCTELAIYASECPQGNMHISPEVSYVEVVDENDQPVPLGQTGQFICTTLYNNVQPLIRYRMGDRGALCENHECACGSSMPVLKSIEGRSDHVLITKDGRKIGRLDSVYKGVEGVRESQIVQKTMDQFVIRVVPGDNYLESTETELINNLTQRLGSADVRVERVDHIERTAAGKFRAVISELAEEQRN